MDELPWQLAAAQDWQALYNLLAHWQSLPWWKRLRPKKPERPTGI